MLAIAAAALLALGQAPTSVLLLPSGEPVSYRADSLRYNGQTQVARLARVKGGRGNCTVETSHVSVKADEILYDQATGIATAHGHVIAVSGLSAAVADDVVADLNTGRIEVARGRYLGKANVSQAALRAASSPIELQRVGTTTFVANGSRMDRIGPGRLEVTDVDMTPCDCNPLEPHWSIRAKRADVILGDHAWLFYPIIYVYHVPVLPLPILYVPLTGRQSGLLVPKPHFTTLSGFGLEQPVFLTLGQSYDLTVTPGFYLGSARLPGPPVPMPATFFGLKGPTLGLDFRYAPSTKVSGEVMLWTVYDLWGTRVPMPQRDPEAGAVLPPGEAQLVEDARRGNGRSGTRGTFNWTHDEDFGAGWRGRLDASLMSDGYLQQDVVTDVLQRTNEYLRSTARVAQVRDETYLGADATLRQDIRFGYNLFNADPVWPASLGVPAHGPNTLQELPQVTFAVPEEHLWGPLSGGFRVDATRIGTLWGDKQYGDREYDAPYNAIAGVNPVLLGIYPSAQPFVPTGPFFGFPGAFGLPGNFPELGNGEARDRLDLNPHLALDFSSPFLHLRPYAAFREDLYAGELTHATSQRAYLVGGASLSSELSRVFDTPSGPIRHVVEPSVEVRSVPFVLGSPLNIYDAVDRAIPYDPLVPDQSTGFTQAVVRLDQTLMRRQGPVLARMVELDLGQELDLAHTSHLEDTYGLVRGSWGPAFAEAALRWYAPAGRATQAWLSGHWGDARGDAVDIRYDGILLGGSDRQRQGLDMLAGSPYPDVATVRALPFTNQLSAGLLGAVVGGLSLRYNVLLQSPVPFYEAPGLPPQAQPVAPFPTPFLVLRQQYLSAVFAPACQCWRIEAGLLFSPTNTPNSAGVVQTNPFGSVDFRFNLTIANFGTFGT